MVIHPILNRDLICMRQSAGGGGLCSRKDKLRGGWRICITRTFTICMCITGEIKLCSTHGSDGKYKHSSENLCVWHPAAIYRLKGEGIYFNQECINKNIIPQYARFKIPHLFFWLLNKTQSGKKLQKCICDRLLSPLPPTFKFNRKRTARYWDTDISA